MLTFTITPDAGDPFDVEASSRDVLMWEKAGKNRSAGDFAAGRYADFYALAHAAAKRRGLFEGSLELFEETCDLEVKQDEEPDPTPTGA